MKKALLMLACAGVLISLPGCCWWRRHCEDECDEGRVNRGRYYHRHDNECGERGCKRAHCEDGSCSRKGYHSRHTEVVEE